MSPPGRPDTDLDSDNSQERERLLQDIRVLADRITRLGCNLPAMRNIARVMSIAAAQGKDAIPTADLEAAQAELTAVFRGFRRREAAHSERVFNLRMTIGASAIAALFAGAMAQKACDPIGRARAYLTTPVQPEGIVPPAPASPPPAPPAPAQSKSAPPAPTPAIRLPPPSPPSQSRGRTIAPESRRPTRVAKAPRVPRHPEAGGGSNIVTLTDRNFESMTSRGIWVVDFYADWCGPCKEMKPVFESVFSAHRNRRSGVHFGKLKVNDFQGDNYAATASIHDVDGIPTIIFFQNGREIGRLTGAGHTVADFERILER